jgi:hypothetical protein
MVLPEVARDPPSPFLTVQADDCDGAVLPVVTPPVAAAPAVPRTPPTAAMGPARTSPFAAGGDDGGGGESNSHGSSSNGITSSSSAGGQWQQQHSQQLPRYQAPVGAGAAAGSAAMTSSSGAAMTAPLNSKRGVQPRSNLQSIVSQQSLDFTVPDSPLEFELAAAAAAAGDGGGSGGGGSGGVQQAAKHKQLAEQQVQQQPAAAAGLGHGPASAAVAGAAADTGAQQDLQAGDTWRPRGLRFLPLKQPRLRSCQSLPQQAPQHKQLAALQLGLGNGSATGSQPQMSYNSCSALPGATNQQQQQQQHSALSRRLRSKVNKLLSWASSSGGSRQSHPGAVPAAPRLSPSRLSAAGAVVVETAFVGSSSVQSQQQQQQQQQQQPWPVPWQQQLFADTSPVQARHSLPGVIGVPLSLRSPRTSLVSSPSGCDCPFFHGRYSSAGSDSCGLSPAGPVGRASTSLVSSYSCSAASSPSPGKLLAVSGDGGGGGSGGGMLLTSTSARPAHHRQRLHRPGCRFYYEQQLLAQQAPQQQFLPQQLQQQLAQQGPQLSQNGSLPLAQQAPQQHQPGLPPVSPTFGGVLQSQSSLRTALQQLESMASLKAARIMDKLNAGLLKMTSSTNRVLDGMALKCGVVGKEVRAAGAGHVVLLTHRGRCPQSRVASRDGSTAAARPPQVMYDWEFGAFLGSGGSCVTRLVIGRDSGRTAACKSISKQGILRSAAVKAALLGVQREVAILQASTGHPHVVQLQAVYEDVHNLHIILEWCAGGHLYSLMERCPGCRLPEHAAAAATKATLEVLAHCHARCARCVRACMQRAGRRRWLMNAAADGCATACAACHANTSRTHHAPP